MRSTLGTDLLVLAVLVGCGSPNDAPPDVNVTLLDSGDPTVDIVDVGPAADVRDVTDESETADTRDDVPTDGAPSDPDTDTVDLPEMGDLGVHTDADATSDDGGPMPAHCESLAEGRNEGFPAGTIPRAFELYLPSNVDTRRDWPVVFAWHGFGEETATMRRFLLDEVDGRYPMILLVPEDVGLELPFGAGWDNLDASDGSLEVELFDQVLECVDARWGVDADRVHSIGFSSGAITSNLLGILRSDRIASIASLSGAYWANPANLNPFASWPAPASGRPSYVQLLTWGGVADSAFGFNFALTAANDQIWLNARGHDVIACDHGGGHALPDAPDADALMAFFAAHPRGVESTPWISGLPDGYPLPWCLVFAGTR